MTVEELHKQGPPVQLEVVICDHRTREESNNSPVFLCSANVLPGLLPAGEDFKLILLGIRLRKESLAGIEDL